MEMPCVFLCVQWCLGVCTCRGVKVRGPCVSSPLIFHSIFWNRVSHGTCSSLAQLWWLPSEHQRSSCIYLLELRSPCLCPRHPGDKEPPFSSSIWRIQHLMQDKLWATNSPNHCHSLVEELYTFEGLWIISTDGEFWVVFSFITLECTTCLLLITWFLKRNPMWCYCLCLWVVCFPGGVLSRLPVGVLGFSWTTEASVSPPLYCFLCFVIPIPTGKLFQPLIYVFTD